MSPSRFAIALALVATSLTANAAAAVEGDVAAAQAPAPSATPLSLRQSKPMELAPEPQHGGAAWKVAFVLVLVGGAALVLRRRAASPLKSRQTELTIVRRAALGLRSELVVVNVEGQRLLIGVTPHTIQSLAILDSDEPEVRESRGADARGPSLLGERFAAMLDTAARGVGTTSPTIPADAPPRRAAAPERPVLHHDDVAEQARGLAALRRAG